MHFRHCLDNFKQCTDPDKNTFIAFNMFTGKRLIFAFFIGKTLIITLSVSFSTQEVLCSNKEKSNKTAV